MAMKKVIAGELLKAEDHNSLVDEINLRQTSAQVKETVDKAVGDLVGAAPETLDTLAELAAALTENQDAVDAINDSISKKADTAAMNTALGKKADKTELATKVDSATFTNGLGKKADKTTVTALSTKVGTLETQMLTSDQPKTVAYNAALNQIVFTYKDSSTKSVTLPSNVAVYG